MVFVCILVGVIGLVVGAIISTIIDARMTYKWLDEVDKNIDEMVESYEKTIAAADKAIANFRSICALKDKLISLYEQDLSLIYNRLVHIRDDENSEHTLDGVIGHLDRILNDSEDDEEETEEVTQEETAEEAESNE